MADTHPRPERSGFARWRRTPYAKGLFTGLGLWLGLWAAYWFVFESGVEFRVIRVDSPFDGTDGHLYRLDGKLLEPNYAGGGMTIYWPIRVARRDVAITEVVGHLPWREPKPVEPSQEITATANPCYIALRRTADGFVASACLDFRPPM